MTTVNISPSAYDSLAEALFLQSSGTNKPGAKQKRMKDAAFQVRKDLEPQIRIRAGYTFYPDLSFQGNILQVHGVSLKCSAFEQLSSESISGAYIYAVSAGNYELPDRPLMDQLYADLWGSAYTEAGRTLLHKELEKLSSLSDSFGPGFYGMALAELEHFSQLIELDELGISIYKNRILLPQKSCIGLLFSVNTAYRKLRQECLSCLGNHTSCRLCTLRHSAAISNG